MGPYSLVNKFGHSDIEYMFAGWIAKNRLILFLDFELYAPDRVMRQFAVDYKHILDPVMLLDSEPTSWMAFLQESIAIWQSRIDRVERAREPPTPLSEYEYWYWQITRRYILKKSARKLVAYILRAPLERDVVSGIYSALDVVDEIEDSRMEPDKVCIDLRRILDTIFDRNKLRRPAKPLCIEEERPRSTEKTHTTLVGGQTRWGEAHTEGEGSQQAVMETQAQWPAWPEVEQQYVDRETQAQWSVWHEGEQHFRYIEQSTHEQTEERPQWEIQQEELIFGSSQQQEIPLPTPAPTFEAGQGIGSYRV